MSITFIHTCDGCGAEWKSASEKSSLHSVGVVIKSGNKATKSDVFDLCDLCEAELCINADPKSWPRPATTGLSP